MTTVAVDAQEQLLALRAEVAELHEQQSEAVLLLRGWRSTNDYPSMRALFAKHADIFLATHEEGK